MPKGIYDRPSLIGKKYWELTVNEFSHIEHGHRYWKCTCSCGKTVVASTSSLNQDNYKSCGHLKSRYAWKGYEEISGDYWSEIKHGAKQRNLEFSIDIEYGWKIFIKQNKRYIYTGLNLTFRKKGKEGRNRQTASLDRINSSKGYIKGNVQWVHKDINQIKWDFTEEEFLRNCKIIYEFNNLKDKFND